MALLLTDATVDTIWQAGVKYDTRQASKKALSEPPSSSARRVRTTHCFKCGEEGHFRDACSKTVLCSICKSPNHCDSQHPKFKGKATKSGNKGGKGKGGSDKGKKQDKSSKGRAGNTPAPSPKPSPSSSPEASRSPSPAKAKVIRHR